MNKVINLLILTLSFIINLMYKSTFEQKKTLSFHLCFQEDFFLLIIFNKYHFKVFVHSYLPQVFLHNKRDWQRPQCPVLKRTPIV